MAHHFDGDKYVGEHLGVKYALPYDTDPTDPRKDYDHLATMACEHGRYNLGDDEGTQELTYAIRNSSFYRDAWENEDDPKYSRHYKGDASTPGGIMAILPLCKDIIWLPLYLYDHSGITMSTGRFSCQWDSGQVGFIFMTKATALENWPDLADKRKSLTPKLRAAAEECMRSEVKEYDAYLTNDVYTWEVDGESCGGYYGVESAAEAAEDYIKGLSETDRDALIARQALEGDQEETED